MIGEILLVIGGVITALAVGYRWGRTPPRDRLPERPPHAPPPIHVIRRPR